MKMFQLFGGKKSRDTIPNPYPLPVYLNKEYAFDLAAMSEEGLFEFEKIEDTGIDGKGSEMELNAVADPAKAGLPPLFRLGGGARRVKQKGKKKLSSKDLTYTPNAIFGKTRRQLQGESRVITNLKEARPGEFVEFTSALQPSPIVDSLKTLAAVMEDFSAFLPPNQQTGMKQQGETALKIIRLFESDDSVDLLGQVGPRRVVVTFQKKYLRGGNPSRLLEGSYTIFGKVLNNFSTDEESINLLRQTSFAKIKPAMIEGLMKNFQTKQIEDLVEMPEFETKIHGPVTHVEAIAIFS